MKHYDSAYHMYIAFRDKFISQSLSFGLYGDTEIVIILKLFNKYVDKIIKNKDGTRNIERFGYTELLKLVEGDVFGEIPEMNKSCLMKVHPDIDFTSVGTFAEDIFSSLFE